MPSTFIYLLDCVCNYKSIILSLDLLLPKLLLLQNTAGVHIAYCMVTALNSTPQVRRKFLALRFLEYCIHLRKKKLPFRFVVLVVSLFYHN